MKVRISLIKKNSEVNYRFTGVAKISIDRDTIVIQYPNEGEVDVVNLDGLDTIFISSEEEDE